MRMWWLVVATSGACAVARNVCPTGSQLNSTVLAEGRVEWCAITESASSNAMPLTTRSYDGALSMAHPVALPGSVDGPFTSWYPNGSLASHGNYIGGGERSLPEGLWAFWREDGRRWVVGAYHRGEPTGCFQVWDDHGQASTGFVEGASLRVATCAPPNDDEIAIVEGKRHVADTPVLYDVTALVFLGNGPIGASNPQQINPDPQLDLAFNVTVRRRFGRLRVGAMVASRSADNSDNSAYAAGASVGWELPKLHPRFDWELDGELAIERLDITAIRAGLDGEATTALWRPLPALQLALALELSTTLYAVAALRVDGIPARTEQLSLTYGTGLGGSYSDVEPWQIGGVTYGANLGLRVVIR